MPHIWNSSAAAETAAHTIKTIMEKQGTLPKDLLRVYRDAISTARPGVVAKFFETLAQECPEALKYFTKPE